MRILVACEFSGRVRDAFTARGHAAMSCDVLPSDTPGPHYLGDVRDLLGKSWDLVIGFPPCTDLAWSNGAYIHAKRQDGRTAAAVEFIAAIAAAGTCSAIENPWRSDLQYWRPSDQKIHPWMFGDPYLKMTGLWLRGLPPLIPAVTDEPEGANYWISVGKAKHRRLGIGKVRNSHERSRTFQGIADAMAEQWG